MLWAALIAASFVAGIVQTITGFGAGVVIMMFLPYFFDLVAAPAINSTICMGLSAGLAWKNRHKLSWRLFGIPLLIYACFGMVCIQLVKGINLDWLGTAFAVFLILLSVYFLFVAKSMTLKPTPAVAFLCSMISGVCGAFFGIGGPLMAIYYSAITHDREEYLGNIQLVFCVSGLLMTLSRVANGIYTPAMLPMSIVGILSVRLGSMAGGRIAEHLSADALRRVVYIGVGVSGAIMLVQKLF